MPGVLMDKAHCKHQLTAKFCCSPSLVLFPLSTLPVLHQSIWILESVYALQCIFAINCMYVRECVCGCVWGVCVWCVRACLRVSVCVCACLCLWLCLSPSLCPSLRLSRNLCVSLCVSVCVLVCMCSLLVKSANASFCTSGVCFCVIIQRAHHVNCYAACHFSVRSVQVSAV